MSKTIQEQIANRSDATFGGFINIKHILDYNWGDCVNPQWNWNSYDYTIVEKKKAVIIEKWLMKAGDRKSFFIVNGDKSYIENYHSHVEKIRLLETYEVEL